MTSGTVVWVAGRAWSNGREVSGWEILGVYSDRELARERCSSPSDFVAPLELDEDLPEERCEWPDAEYPLEEGRR